MNAPRSVDILLIEDSPSDRLLTASALEQTRLPSTLHTVSNGLEAMAFLLRQAPHEDAPRPDLILLDLNMPRMGGHEFLDRMKKEPELRDIPVVVLTTSEAREDVAAAYAAHANSYIRKPVQFDEFAKAIEALQGYWFNVVTLPPRPEAARRASPAGAEPGALPVLIIEDSPTDLLLLEHHLRDAFRASEGLSIESASHLGAARELIEKHRFAVVITDLNLPDSTGVDTVTALRRLQPTAPIIVLTGDIDDRSGSMAIRAGADDYLVKDDISPRAIRRAVTHARERRAMQSQLQRASQHRMVAHLAGSVAHDFNNLLTVIRANAEAIRSDGLDPSLLREITDATRRGERLTRQLLAHGRRQPLKPEPTSLRRFFHRRMRLLDRLAGDNVRLRLELAPEPLQAQVDRDALELMVYNLVSNAVDAMPDGGNLTISSGPHPRGTELIIADDGTGIPADILPSVLEPFYTTKGRQAGSGLGLSSVLQTAQALGGDLELESELGVGTRARIILPLADELENPSLPPETPNGRTGRGECLLVVDDVPEVLHAVARNLQRAGYQTKTAGNRKDALEIARQGGIDLVLSDLLLGTDRGTELAADLARLGLADRVVFMSGYSQEFGGDDSPLRPGENFIQKPFSPHALSRLIREALDRSA